MVVHGIGTASEIDSRDNLLFLEDVGEYLYNTDRMMMQLKRAGKLDRLAGIIFGSFTEMKTRLFLLAQTFTPFFTTR